MRATENAHRLLDIEAALHLDFEAWANHLILYLPGLPLAASYWYSALHYIVTPAVLVWVYRRHPLGYRRVRNVLVGSTAVALLGFVLLPMAPPRMLPGYVDVLATTSVNGWWGSDASAPKGLGGLTNELAAMPSMHVGWALWCAWVVFLCTRNRLLRTLVAVYATGTTVVVVITANHYLLDAVAGVAIVAAAVLVTRPRVRRRTPDPAATHITGYCFAVQLTEPDVQVSVTAPVASWSVTLYAHRRDPPPLEHHSVRHLRPAFRHVPARSAGRHPRELVAVEATV